MNDKDNTLAEQPAVFAHVTAVKWLDQFPDIRANILDSVTIGWLFVLIAFAPHSIAVTQGAWLLALLGWAVRRVLFARSAPPWRRSSLDLPLLLFFCWTTLSAFLSYESAISLGKLRGAALFTIVFLFSQMVRSRLVLHALTLLLVISAMVVVAKTVGERIAGQGVKVEGVSPASPLARATYQPPDFAGVFHGVNNGDTLLEADGKPLHSPDDLVAALADTTQPGQLKLKVYRVEWLPVFEVQRGQLLPGTTALERLGVSSWTHGRDWRAAGFFGHFTTFAEALQLILSLAFGLFIALDQKRSYKGLALACALAGLGFALLLTVTRASQLAFMVSAFVIVLVGSRSKRALFILLGCALPLALVALVLLQQKRHVGLIDAKDNSTEWRREVWREAFDVLISKPRHLLVGVGMDSVKRRAREWAMFDNGKLPPGHMHNTYLQFAFERGVPALLLWCWILFTYFKLLWRAARSDLADWRERGLILGALGGAVGFCISGLVHYNYGDSEVLMIFYCVMGLVLACVQMGERRLRVVDGGRA